jgi:hypothetical protein
MKKIEIQGKRNQDKMKQMDDPNATIERKIQPKRAKVVTDEFYTSDQSLVLDILKMYVLDLSTGTGGMKYADDVTKLPPSNHVLSTILREIDGKRKAYIYQDKQHNIYDPRYTVTTNKIVELMVNAELYVTTVERFVRSRIKKRCVGDNGLLTGLIITTVTTMRM